MTVSPLYLRAFVATAAMALTAFASAGVRPVDAPAPAAPDIEALLPDEFAGWRRIGVSGAVLPSEGAPGPGEAVAYTAYADDLGRVVTLVVVYGPPGGDQVRLHRPEVCYVAQGFALVARSTAAIDAGGRTAPVVHLATEQGARREAVSYLLRQGDAFTTDAREGALASLFGAGRRGEGVLIRASSVHGAGDSGVYFARHERFLSDMSAALGPEGRATLLGREAS